MGGEKGGRGGGHYILLVLSCGCCCAALALIGKQLNIFQCSSIIYLIMCIISFTCTQYILYLVVDTLNTYSTSLGIFCWRCIISNLYLRVPVLMTEPQKNVDMAFLRRFSTPLSLTLSLSTFWVFRHGNDDDRYGYRYGYRRYFGLIVPKRSWFRYPTLVLVFGLDERYRN